MGENVTKIFRTLITCWSIILLTACAPSLQAIQTAIAQTQAAWTPTNTPTSTFTPTSTWTPTSTSTPTFTPTTTLTPTITSTPINPLDRIVSHRPNQGIPYQWFTYVPSGLDKTKPVFILITAIGAQMGTYDDLTIKTGTALQDRLRWPNINNFVLLAPVIPSIFDDPYLGNIISIEFDIPSFTTSDKFYQRADLKVISIIDEFSDLLREDGYIVNEKVLIEGFSASAMFAQRFALLHPDRVLAIAAGSCGGNFVLPLKSYNGIPINWPVGINDLKTLADIEFDQNEYKNISQFIYIGDQDTQHSTVPDDAQSATGHFEAVSQIDFFKPNIWYYGPEKDWEPNHISEKPRI